MSHRPNELIELSRMRFGLEILHAALPVGERGIHHFQTPGNHGSLGPFLMLYMQPNTKDTLSLCGVVLIPRDLMIGGSEVDQRGKPCPPCLIEFLLVRIDVPSGEVFQQDDLWGRH